MSGFRRRRRIAPRQAAGGAERDGTDGRSSATRVEPLSSQRPRRAGAAQRGRNAGAAAVGAVGSGILLVSRLILTVTLLIVLLILTGILLRDLLQPQSGAGVKAIHDAANFFAGWANGLYSDGPHFKREITVNWGIALLAYLVVGAGLARVIGRVGRGGRRFEDRHRTAVR